MTRDFLSATPSDVKPGPGQDSSGFSAWRIIRIVSADIDASSRNASCVPSNIILARRPPAHATRPLLKRLDGLHDAAQLGEALEAADEGIAGVDALLAVVAEEVAVVRPHRDFGVGPPLVAAAPLLAHQLGHEGDEVRIAAEMIGLGERSVRFALDVAQVDEMHARPELPRHGDEIVRRVRAERAGAERGAAGF